MTHGVARIFYVTKYARYLFFLLREIKKQRPDLPVMMVTAYGDEERRRQAAEAGALQFLSKPVDFDLLKEELRRLPEASA
jgi:DNA-binding NtrC family response regulator